jgi:hypothetical protein
MPIDPWKQKLTPVNPLPANRKVSEPLNETGADMAKMATRSSTAPIPATPSTPTDAASPAPSTIVPTSLGTSERKP